MGLFKNKNTFKISPTDWNADFISKKIIAGENVEINLEPTFAGEKLVVSSNKTQSRKTRYLNSDGVINSDEYLVLVDASKNHVVVTLPPAFDYVGQLSIVCISPDYGIDVVVNGSTNNIIFDNSDLCFNSKGDSFTLVSDRGVSVTRNCDSDDEDVESQFWGRAKDKIKETIQDVKEEIKETIQEIKEEIKDTIQEIKEEFNPPDRVVAAPILSEGVWYIVGRYSSSWYG